MALKKLHQQYKQARKRFQADFRLSLITLFCLPAAIAIGGFAVFRAIDHNWLMATVDSLLVAALLGILAFSWFTGRTRGAGIILVFFTGCGVLAVVYLAGLVGLFWAFVDVIASFFLSPPMFAVPKVIIVTVVALILGVDAGLGTLPLISFATTIFVVALFAYSFAIRAPRRRRMSWRSWPPGIRSPAPATGACWKKSSRLPLPASSATPSTQAC